jgi:hypothetical protein
MSTRAAIARRIEQPEVRAALVDDPPAVGLRVARVIVVVVGVPREAGAVGQARVEIAHALEIRQEEHAAVDAHRARDVAGELGHPPERAAARLVDPQVAGRAAAVALPPRRVGGVAADDARAAGTVREVIHLPQLQQLRHPAGGVDRPGAIVAEERLAPGRHEQDPALGRPAAHHHVRPEPGQPPRRAAGARHQVDLGMLLVAADESEPAAVGGQAGRRRFGHAGRQPARHAAARVHTPHVVVGDERDGAPAKRRVAQVASGAHGNASASHSGGGRNCKLWPWAPRAKPRL